MSKKINRKNQKGMTLIMGTISLLLIIPMIGLAVDVGFLYAIKSRMQAAVDGAALSAARALSIGQTLAAQTTSAQDNAVSWFNANFPSNYFGVTNITMSSANVTVAQDANNAQLWDVSVNASASVNAMFMRWLGFTSTTVAATGTASRRTVVAMLVLDRSGSMCQSGSTNYAPCLGTDATYPCGQMVTAAKLFTGSFAEGNDYIGLVSFADGSYVHSAPSQSFQTNLGYQNTSGTGAGEIDKINCGGGTGTAEAMSLAYQLLYQTNLPGALNVIVLETDGLPNTLAMNFWDSTNTVAGISNTSNCTDTNSKKMSNGGFASLSALPAWSPGLNFTAAPFLTSNSYYSNFNNSHNLIGTVASSDPGATSFWSMINYWTTFTQNSQSRGSSSYPYNAVVGTASPSLMTNTTNTAPGCAFNGTGGYGKSSVPDVAWFPQTDIFGDQLNPSAYTYQTVSTDAQGHVKTSGGWSNYHNAVLNATDNSAYLARTNANFPVYVMTIGLGGNSTTGPPDPVLLQRMANDPNGDRFNTTGPDTGGAYYLPCAQETGCTTYTSQPQGTFVYTPNTTNLGPAFLSIASQVLRLSK